MALGLSSIVKFPENLLVLGGTGFIGHHICREGVKRGFNVTSVSLNEPKASRRVKDVDYKFLDISHPAAFLDFYLNKFAYVIVASGYVDHSYKLDKSTEVADVHLNSIFRLANHLDKAVLQKVVYIGSADEYGSSSSPLDESVRETPFSVYSFSKTACTHFLQMLARSQNFPVVICRLFLVYGPGQNSDRFIPQIINGCLADTLVNTTPGEQVRDFCFIDDVVDALFLCLEKRGVEGMVFNIGLGSPRTVRSVVEIIQSLIGKGQINFGGKQYRKGESMECYPNISAAQEVLGWSPKTGLEEGLRKTVDTFRLNE